MGISITEYAKREGISRQAAHKRIAKGKITLLADGTIDEAKAASEWAANKDELQVQRGTEKGRERKRHIHTMPKRQTPPADDEPAKRGGPTFAELQRAEKALKVQRDTIKLKREQGKLIEVEEARRAWADMISTARGALLPIGGELADSIAGEPDPIRVREMIDRRIHQALSLLADYNPTPIE